VVLVVFLYSVVHFYELILGQPMFNISFVTFTDAVLLWIVKLRSEVTSYFCQVICNRSDYFCCQVTSDSNKLLQVAQLLLTNQRGA